MLEKEGVTVTPPDSPLLDLSERQRLRYLRSDQLRTALEGSQFGADLGELFAGRTNVNVLRSHVAKVLLAEAPFRL